MVSGRFVDFAENLLENREKERILSGIIELCDWKKMLKNQKNIDILEAQALMQRMGVMNGLCEFVVEEQEFDYLCLREEIWESFYQSRWETWERKMEQCQAFNTKNRLYRQFYEEMVCRKMLQEKQEPGIIASKLRTTLRLTKETYLVKNISNEFLSSGEMRLLELYALVLERQGKKKEAKAIFDYLAAFLELKCEDDYLKLQLLPDLYVVYGAFLARCQLQREEREIVKRGLDLLDIYHKDWNRKRLTALWKGGDTGWNACIQTGDEIEKRYWEMENGNDACSEADLLKKISPLSEILLYCRKAVGMTQKEVTGAYCDTAQISRIENGKRFPKQNTLLLLEDRLGISRGSSFYMLQEAGYHQIVALMRVISDLYKNDYTCAWKRLQYLENCLDMTQERNRQFILFAKAFVSVELRKTEAEYENIVPDGEIKAELNRMIPKHADDSYWPFQTWEFLGMVVCIESRKGRKEKERFKECIIKNYQKRKACESRFGWEIEVLQKM